MTQAKSADFGFCYVCKVAVARTELIANHGTCRLHRDHDDSVGGKGCPECGHPTSHYRDCEQVSA